MRAIRCTCWLMVTRTPHEVRQLVRKQFLDQGGDRGQRVPHLVRDAGRQPADAGVLRGAEESSSIFFFSVMSSSTRTYPLRAPLRWLTLPLRMMWGSKFRLQVISPSFRSGVKSFGSGSS